MLTPESLDPEEVLSHLNALGYNDITPKQLKEFIKDLKKLIKYDQKYLNLDRVETHSCGYDGSCSESDNRSDKLSSNETYESSECSSSTTYEDRGYEEINKAYSKSGINLERVQSSFIRPWNLPSHNSTGRNRKNLDPVRLYHRYKESWSRFNIPGEKKHAELRWGIRNRMLGQEPQPRVVT